MSDVIERVVREVVAKETDERVTPRWLIEELKKEFFFVLDAAARKGNAIVGNYLGLDHPLEWRRDGLTADWLAAAGGRFGPGTAVWCNPPYSRGSIPLWCAKAAEEAERGVRTVMLLSADTSTDYFHRFVLRNRHRFIKRRLVFGGAPRDSKGRAAPAKFGSVLVIFEPGSEFWTRG